MITTLIAIVLLFQQIAIVRHRRALMHMLQAMRGLKDGHQLLIDLTTQHSRWITEMNKSEYSPEMPWKEWVNTILKGLAVRSQKVEDEKTPLATKEKKSFDA